MGGYGGAARPLSVAYRIGLTMRESIPSNRIVPRNVPAGLFIVIGLSVTAFFLLLGGASWLVLCFLSLVPLGILWIRRPDLAAVLSVGPLLGIASSIRIPAHGPGPVSPLLVAAAVTLGIAVPFAALIAGVFFLLTALRDWRRWWLPVVLSFAFVAAAFGTDRLFLDVNTVKTYKMHFSLDGKALDLRLPAGYVVVYRSAGNGYCFDEIKSRKLYDHLALKPGDEVMVQYEIASDFGRPRGYNVLTVDGIDVRDENAEGGSGSGGSGTSPRCF